VKTMKNEIVTKNTNTEVTVPVTESSSSRSIRKRAKFLVENDLLPMQNSDTVDEQGLFKAPFANTEGKAIAKKVDWFNGYDHFGLFGGIVLGIPAVGFGWGNIPSGFEWAFLIFPLVVMPTVVKSVRNRVYNKLMKNMRTEANKRFSEWARNRYDLNLGTNDYGSKIAVGSFGSLNIRTIHWPNGERYTINEKVGGIYLAFDETSRQPSEAKTLVALDPVKQLEASGSVAPEVKVALPEEVEALHQAVQEATTKLRQQDLSVEVAHGLQRVQEAVQGVMATYLNINQLKPSEAADEDLKQFLQDQLTAVEELTSEHVNDLARQMKLDIDSVSRSTVVGSGLQL
jgi:hypothetical protein